MRKTGALLGTTFVLSLHAVFHNVICNWCNRAVQFLSIIVLGCPLQPYPAYVYNTCACTVDPFRVYFHEFYEYSSKPKGFVMSRPTCHCSRLFSRANTRKYSDLNYRRSVSYCRQKIRREKFHELIAGNYRYALCWPVYADSNGSISFFFSARLFFPRENPTIFVTAHHDCWGDYSFNAIIKLCTSRIHASASIEANNLTTLRARL